MVMPFVVLPFGVGLTGSLFLLFHEVFDFFPALPQIGTFQLHLLPSVWESRH